MNAPPATPAVLVAYPVNRYHPGIQLSMGEARETELIERLRKRDIEVAILRLSLIEPPDDMDVIQLFDERRAITPMSLPFSIDRPSKSSATSQPRSPRTSAPRSRT